MLVLTRRHGESIMIGDDILIVVSDIRPDRVKIGIQAPREINVARMEVAAKKSQGELPAASPAATAEVYYDRTKRKWKAVITDPRTPGSKPSIVSRDLSAIRELLDKKGIAISSFNEQ